MDQKLLGTAAAVAIVTALAGPAAAADLRMPIKAPAAAPAVVPYAPTWAGFYIGGHLEYGWVRNNGFITNDSETSIIPINIKASGFGFGVQSGYNWQLGPAPWGSWIFGIESDVSFTPWSGTVNGRDVGGAGITVHSHSRIDWLSSIRGRLGLAIDRTLLYVTGGGAWAATKHDMGGSSTRAVGDFKESGAVFGGGIEWKYNPSVSFRVEVLEYWFNDKHNVSVPDWGGDVGLKDVTVVRWGMNWMLGQGDLFPSLFGKGKGPVTARY